MRYCEAATGIPWDACGDPASVKIRGVWYCEACADAIERDEALAVDEYGYADAGNIE